MDDYCPYCGTPLKVVKGRWFCPNHGFIDEQEENNEEIRKPSYFG